MTVLSLSNLKVVSENRQYSFSARSGSAHSFSSDFRYVLKKGWRTRWKANQHSGTRPPVELYVSDDGYTVARLHGHRSHPLVARDPFGNELGQVLLSHGENECSATEFSDEYFSRSSAGLFIRGSLGYFFNANGTYFGIHFAWNRRLLMHIETGLLLTGEIDPEIAEAARSAEIKTALHCLNRGLRLKPGKRDIRFRGAVGTLLNNQPSESIDIFRILEAEPTQVFAYTSSITLKGLYYGYLGFRTQAALALRMNGHLPRGYPAIGLFTRGNSKQPLRWPEKLVDRDERLNSLSLSISR